MENEEIENPVVSELTKEKVREMVLAFNFDSSVERLRRYYATPTVWEITGQARKETSHTQFLAYLFGTKFNEDCNYSAVKRLILLLLKWAENQNIENFHPVLAESVYKQSLTVSKCQACTEVLASEEKYGNGRIDVLINCEAEIHDEANSISGNVNKKINILIEGKIGANETRKGDYFQTDMYHKYITDEYGGDENINLFVLLKPSREKLLSEIKEPECHCKKYIQIDFQELLDNVIQPISEQKELSPEHQFILKDYIRALGVPSETENGKQLKQIRTMAIGKEEKELLRSIFNKNERLIRAMIETLGDKGLTESMANYPGNRYSINGEGSYTMYGVLEEFIKFRFKARASIQESIQERIQEIDREIRSFVYIRRKNPLVSEAKNGEDKRWKKFKLKDGPEIVYSTQWGDGGQLTNFTKFRQNVSVEYPNQFEVNKLL